MFSKAALSFSPACLLQRETCRSWIFQVLLRVLLSCGRPLGCQLVLSLRGHLGGQQFWGFWLKWPYHFNLQSLTRTYSFLQPIKTSQLPYLFSGKESTCQCRRLKFDPWVRKIPWRRKWQPAPIFLPGKSDQQKHLVGNSPWSCKRIGHNVVIKEEQNFSNTNANIPSSVLWAAVDSFQLVCAYRLLVLPIGFRFTSEALFIFLVHLLWIGCWGRSSIQTLQTHLLLLSLFIFQTLNYLYCVLTNKRI